VPGTFVGWTLSVSHQPHTFYIPSSLNIYLGAFKMRDLLLVAFFATSVATVSGASSSVIQLKDQFVSVIEEDSLKFPIVNFVSKGCAGISGGYSSVSCSVEPCQATGATCTWGSYVPGCCTGTEATGSNCTGQCGNKCPAVGSGGCTIAKTGCTSPRCFNCPSEYKVTEIQTSYNYTCFETGVTRLNGTKYSWATACGTVEGQFVCQAWRTDYSVSPALVGMISVMYPCSSIQDGECGTSSSGSGGRDLKKKKSKKSSVKKVKTTKVKSTKSPTPAPIKHTRRPTVAPTVSPMPSDAPSSSPTPCPYDCASPNICKAFNGIDWFLGDNFLSKNMFPTPTQGIVTIAAPKLIIGDKAVNKWSDIVSQGTLCYLETSISKCAKTAKDHTAFVKCVGTVTKYLDANHWLRSQDAKFILKLANESNVGLSKSSGGRSLRADA